MRSPCCSAPAAAPLAAPRNFTDDIAVLAAEKSARKHSKALAEEWREFTSPQAKARFQQAKARFQQSKSQHQHYHMAKGEKDAEEEKMDDIWADACLWDVASFQGHSS